MKNMMIDRIKNLGQNSELKKASPIKDSEPEISSDKIAISSAAKELTQEVKLLSDVKQFTISALSMGEDADRVQKLSQIKAKLTRGDYDNISHEVAEKTANKLLQPFLEI
jgi:hypothetical protein